MTSRDIYSARPVQRTNMSGAERSIKSGESRPVNRRGRSAAVKSAKIKKTLIEYAIMAAVVTAITAIVLLLIRTNNQVPPDDRFCEGVFVNGIALGGMTYEQGVATLQEDVDRRINQDSYVLTFEGRQWIFTPKQFNAHLDLSEGIDAAWSMGHFGTDRDRRLQAESLKSSPFNYEKPISYDEGLLTAFLQDIKQEVDLNPIAATITADELEQLPVTPSTDGRSLSIENLKQTLNTLIMQGNTMTVELQPDVVKPAFTTEEMLACQNLIVRYATSLKTSSSVRNFNVKHAMSRINGIKVNPGETISFNQLVGRRTKANGFKEAPEYDGTTVISGIGGGTCQVSSTLYGALLQAGSEIVPVVRQSHSMTVVYAKPSMDAVVSDNGKDLRFTNFGQYPIFIYGDADSARAEVRIYGHIPQYEIKLESKILSEFSTEKIRYERDTKGKHVYYKTDPPVLKTEAKMGMRSEGFRVYYDRNTGEEVDRESMGVDTYRASQAVYYRGVH